MLRIEKLHGKNDLTKGITTVTGHLLMRSSVARIDILEHEHCFLFCCFRISTQAIYVDLESTKSKKVDNDHP